MLTIGIVYDSETEYGHLARKSADQYAEFEPESTIEIMESAVKRLNFIPIRIGGPLELLKKKPHVDVIWNIGEGFGTRNREAWTPVLCEMYQIPCLGSDAFSLTRSLDKSTSKEMAKKIGIPTPEWIIADFKSQNIPEINFFPVFVKPRYEGTAKGISPSSIAKNSAELIAEIHRQWALYEQDLVVEKYLTGAEYTFAMSGNPIKCHAGLERGIDKNTKIGIHALENKGILVDEYELSHSLNTELEQKLADCCVALCKEMEILDFARLDFKCDEAGKPHFLEINPLPTFATDNTFAILAELENVSYDEFLSKILNAALNRLLKK